MSVIAISLPPGSATQPEDLAAGEDIRGLEALVVAGGGAEDAPVGRYRRLQRRTQDLTVAREGVGERDHHLAARRHSVRGVDEATAGHLDLTGGIPREVVRDAQREPEVAATDHRDDRLGARDPALGERRPRRGRADHGRAEAVRRGREVRRRIEADRQIDDPQLRAIDTRGDLRQLALEGLGSTLGRSNADDLHRCVSRDLHRAYGMPSIVQSTGPWRARTTSGGTAPVSCPASDVRKTSRRFASNDIGVDRRRAHTRGHRHASRSISWDAVRGFGTRVRVPSRRGRPASRPGRPTKAPRGWMERPGDAISGVTHASLCSTERSDAAR
jgi:hypothetical protein